MKIALLTLLVGITLRPVPMQDNRYMTIETAGVGTEATDLTVKFKVTNKHRTAHAGRCPLTVTVVNQNGVRGMMYFEGSQRGSVDVPAKSSTEALAKTRKMEVTPKMFVCVKWSQGQGYGRVKDGMSYFWLELGGDMVTWEVKKQGPARSIRVPGQKIDSDAEVTWLRMVQRRK